MHWRKAILLLALVQWMTVTVEAQLADKDTAIINFQLKDNRASFNSTLRPLHQLAGAPESFYSYYWEFGDGKFSFEENPKHVYKDTGSYDARLFATNNYDDGKPPPTRPKPLRIRSKNNTYAVNDNTVFFKEGGAIEMRVNSMPKADEDMVLIVGYRNEKGNAPMSGSVVLFYNEKQFRKNNFNLTDERIYNNEKRSSLASIVAFAPAGEMMETPSSATTGGPNATPLNENPGQFWGKLSELIASKQKAFRQNNAWRFTDLRQSEEKYFFITLHTTPEMIRDTNAVVELNTLFIPDDPTKEIEEYALALQIVASHDPNRMMLKNRRLNYRFTGTKKEMVYTVRFQNTGGGPARQASVSVGIPPMLDAKSIEIIDHYPKCVFCNSMNRPGQSCLDTIIHKDSIFFVFNNIYLPGLRQEGMTDPDSTVGYVKYRLHFNKALKKLPFQSNAAIVFDNNKVIYTNSPKGYFKPGNSPGIIVGYKQFLGKNFKDENYFSIGAGISPYSPYKKYLQAEMLFGYLQLPEQFVGAFTSNVDTVINSTTFRILGREIYAKQKIFKLDLVPLQLRKNINDWFGAGAGTLITVDALTKFNNREVLHMVQQPNPTPITQEKTYTATKWFSNFDVAVFGDLQLGRVRLGPVGGLRFLHYFRVPRNCVFLYAAWRL